MVTIEERELFLKAVSDPSEIAYKPEPVLTKKLARKRVSKPYDASIDLHGLTAEKATQRLKAFLYRCVELNQRQVLIIHGKGSGVLRYEMRSLLAGSDLVREIKEVPAKLGGDGAVIAILKNQK